MIKSNQTIDTYADCRNEHSNWPDNAIEDYQQLKADINALIEFSNNLESSIDNGDFSPQFGVGSPEGVVTANYSLKYIDTSVPTEYYNPAFGSDTGWVAL